MNLSFDSKELLEWLQETEAECLSFLKSLDVPEFDYEDNDNDYLLENKSADNDEIKTDSISTTELQERLNLIKNKMRQKKGPGTEQAQQKRATKKLKNSKEFQKVLVTAAKAIKNENAKQKNYVEDMKTGVKSTTHKPIFNAEGKIVYSKFDFAAYPGSRAKQSHQNPREVLKKLKETDKKLNELKAEGNIEKVAEIKNDLAWQKAFDKIEGKKVKDDVKLLYKAIKKRKDEKKKSKIKWSERKQRVENEMDKKQKKRQENLEKRIKDKKNKKLKKLSKKGRVIPGF